MNICSKSSSNNLEIKPKQLPKTRQLKGVRDVCAFGNRAVVLSEDLKGTVVPNVLYSVELKPMHKAKGYVVVAATPINIPNGIHKAEAYPHTHSKV